jgi:geranylgeranyl pyrophosphate synthase
MLIFCMGLADGGERDRVLAYAYDFARRAMPTPELASVLDTALIGLDEHARRSDLPFIIDLPLSVYAAIRGERAPAIPIAAAIGLMYLGFDIGDDLTDGDLPPHWQGRSVAEIEIIMVALVASLPPALIDALDVPADVRARMQGGFARRLMTMLGGQHRDVRAAGTADVTAKAVEESVAAKTGEEFALFAWLAAVYAGATPAELELYDAMGRALGTALQFRSDCRDLFNATHSKDLAAGTRTLPIALTLERLTGDARAEFVALLDRARSDTAAGVAVRQRIRAARVVPLCAMVIEVYRQQALAAIEAAGAPEPARQRLRSLCDFAWPPPVTSPSAAPASR